MAWADGPVRPPDLGVSAELRQLDPTKVKYELEFTASEIGGELQLSVSYLTELFDEATIAVLLDRLVSTAVEVVADPQSRARGAHDGVVAQ